MTQTIEQLTTRVRELEEEKRIAELIAELEHIREQKNLLWFEFSIATQQLAAEQLNNKLLRKALEAVIKVHGYESGIPVEAISTQASTEALDKYVAEKVKEATLPVADELQKTRLQMITDFGQYQESHEQVATLTRQRDLAVEALKEIMEYAGIIEERCDSIATDKYDVLFEDAGLCRRVQTKCGKEAKHFEPNKLGFFGRLFKNVHSR